MLEDNQLAQYYFEGTHRPEDPTPHPRKKDNMDVLPAKIHDVVMVINGSASRGFSYMIKVRNEATSNTQPVAIEIAMNRWMDIVEKEAAAHLYLNDIHISSPESRSDFAL